MSTEVCVCEHPHSTHEHYRAGSDCSLCFCTKFKLSERELINHKYVPPLSLPGDVCQHRFVDSGMICGYKRSNHPDEI